MSKTNGQKYHHMHCPYGTLGLPLNALFTGAIEATEEAVYNALVAAETTTGIDGHVLEAISHERLEALLHH